MQSMSVHDVMPGGTCRVVQGTRPKPDNQSVDDACTLQFQRTTTLFRVFFSCSLAMCEFQFCMNSFRFSEFHLFSTSIMLALQAFVPD